MSSLIGRGLNCLFPSNRAVGKDSYSASDQNATAELDFLSLHDVESDENEVDSIIEEVKRALRKIFDCRIILVLILNNGRDKFLGVENDCRDGILIHPKHGICGQAIAQRRVLSFRDGFICLDEPYNTESLKKLGGARSLLCSPMICKNGDVYGVILAVDKYNQHGRFSNFTMKEECDVAKISSHAAVAIRKAITYRKAHAASRISGCLLSIVRACSCDHTIEEVLHLTIDSAYDLFLPERASIYLCDHYTKEAWICASRDALEGFCVPFGHGVAGTVAETGSTIRVDNVYEDPRFITYVDSQTGFRSKSMLCAGVPGFCREGKPIAVIQLINKTNGRSFDEDDEAALTEFSKEVSVALRRKMVDISLLKVSRNLRAGSSESDRYSSARLEESLLREYGSVTQRFKYSTFNNARSSVIRLRAKVNAEAKQATDESKSCHLETHSESHAVTVESPFNLCGSELCKKIEHWDLDPFSYQDSDLMTFTEQMFFYFDLAEAFQIPHTTLRNFIMAVHAGYNASNSFHNFRHGWSVQHMSYLILRNGAAEFLEPLDILAVLVASICHDIDHPGNNNAFEMLTQSELSDMYTDDAILERHHASSTMKLLRDPSRQIVANLSLSDRILFRRQVVSGIMATDMAAHFNLVEQMELCSKRQPHFDIQEESSRRSLVGHIIHCADLSGQALPLDLALKWGDCLMEEFKQQSLKEAALGLPLTPFMQGLDEEINRMKLQYGFVSNIVVPLWEAISANFPALEHMHKNAVANKSYYRDLIDSLAGNQQLDAESL